MATKTNTLSLTLPGLGEFTDSWDKPVNENFEKVDTAIGDIRNEIQLSRGNFSSLSQFLAVAHVATGELKPTKEVEASRNSFLYGHKPGEEPSDLPFTLDELSTVRDSELWRSRQSQTDIQSGYAFPLTFEPNKVLAGPADSNGFPSYLAGTGTAINVNVTSTPVYLMIQGKVCRIRNSKTVNVSSSEDGTYYLYATYDGVGKVILESDPNSGAITTDSFGDARMHVDTSKDFTLVGNSTEGDVTDVGVSVKPFDLLRYTGNSFSKAFLIAEVTPSNGPLTNNSLLLRGKSTDGIIAGVSYDILDPLGVEITVESTEEPTTGTNKVCLAQFTKASGVISELIPRAYGDTFVSAWVSVGSITTATETILTHGLGTDVLDITVQARPTSDTTFSFITNLPITNDASNLGVTYTQPTAAIGTLAAALTNPAVTNTLAVAGNEFTPALVVNGGADGLTGTVSLTGGSVALSGAPTLSGGDADLTGAVKVNGVIAQYNKNTIRIKHPYAGFFYKDLAGATQTGGFMRVIITKKR